MAAPCRERGGKGKPNMAEPCTIYAFIRDTIIVTASRPLAVIILAAGQGTRMKSSLHKVLHPVAGRPMLLHLLASVAALEPERQVVVVGAGREQVEAAVAGTGAVIAVQDRQLGTGHAVRQAHDALAGFAGDVLILYGDVPLVSGATMRGMLDRLNRGDDPRAVVLGFRPDDAAAYGRIIADGQGIIEKMVEYKDASDAERAVTLCNSGLMAVRSTDLFVLLDQIGNDNAAGEYYLPDIIMLPGAPSAVIETEAWEVAGVNSRVELAGVEAMWQARRRAEAMREGVTLVAPETVFFAHDTVLGRDVVVEPNVVFGPGVTVADDVVIHAFSHLEGASVETGAAIGPYARLRPGAQIGVKAKVGNFVEIKKAVLGEGAKVNHLSYIGDASVGAGANIGAGTITCNYDGFFKYKTEIGAGAFVGSNSALVAPVSIGAGAIVAAGSVVTRSVEADALCLVRPVQEGKPGWAARFRGRMAARKAAAKG
jgi:bifunctional UDP-N-acetylglucosamine pyrophosphorylase/glucosamine-1-phosphate N-acetyltransferase